MLTNPTAILQTWSLPHSNSSHAEHATARCPNSEATAASSLQQASPCFAAYLAS